MEFETRNLWNASLAAREAARTGDTLAACEAIDELEGIALHGASKAARAAFTTLQGMAAQEEAFVACYARQALGRLQAA